jgi:hypothetical protein
MIWVWDGMMTKAKSRIRFCCCIHAKEFNGIFVYAGAMNRFFQSTMVAVIKYKWVGSLKDGKVMFIFVCFFRRPRRKNFHETICWVVIPRRGRRGSIYIIFKFARLADKRLIPTDSKTTSTISSSSWILLSRMMPSPHDGCLTRVPARYWASRTEAVVGFL